MTDNALSRPRAYSTADINDLMATPHMRYRQSQARMAEQSRDAPEILERGSPGLLGALSWTGKYSNGETGPALPHVAELLTNSLVGLPRSIYDAYHAPAEAASGHMPN